MLGALSQRRSGAGAALALLAMVGQLAPAGLGGLAALGGSGAANIIEICTAYGIQRIALDRDPGTEDDGAPARPSGTAACHVFCTAHGPTLPASVALPGPGFALRPAIRPGVPCDPAPVLYRHQPLLARPPPTA